MYQENSKRIERIPKRKKNTEFRAINKMKKRKKYRTLRDKQK